MKTAKALNPSKKLVYSVGELAEVLGVGLPGLKSGGAVSNSQAGAPALAGQPANNRDWNRVIFVGKK